MTARRTLRRPATRVAAAAVLSAAAGVLTAVAPAVTVSERAVAAPACSSASTPASTKPAFGTRPVIFVHGWTSDGSALRNTGQVLTRQTDGKITPYYFDYGQNSTTWAGSDAVSGCLTQYISAVAKTYYAAAGDGKVLIVAHSMGGLATLYAAGSGSTAADIGGVVTLDTPYLGSPFGNSGIAGLLQGHKQANGVSVPPPGSDAQVCLGQHQDGAPLPAGCHYTLPPYLPRTVPITEIAGSVTVKRMFGPFHLYDIPLNSDGIVPVESSHGYLQAQPKSAWPMGEQIRSTTDACAITSDTLTSAAEAAGWTGPLLGGITAGATELYADNNALDGLLSGTLTPGLAAYLGAATLAAPCSHIHVYNDQSALNQATAALKADLAALAAKDPQPIKTETITGIGYPVPGTYRMTLWAKDNQTDCAAHSYGQVAAFFAQHPCRAMTRYLWTLPFHGRTVVLSVVSTIQHAGPLTDNFKYVYEYAEQFGDLEKSSGTGSVNDLLREGHWIPGVATTIPRNEVFRILGEDSGVDVFDAWYATGTTHPNDPDLKQLEENLFLTRASRVDF